MTTGNTDRAAQIERAQVEQLFGLTGGELSNRPWIARDAAADESAEPWHIGYWFDGVPEYAGTDYPDRHDSEYRTAVTCCLFGLPPETLTDANGAIWIRQRDYGSSGETECVYGDGSPESEIVTAEQAEDGTCPYCEASVGESHGHIYLGEGWAEVVYRRDRLTELQQIAESNNVECWEETAVAVYCGECDDTFDVPESCGTDGGCPGCDAAPDRCSISVAPDAPRGPKWWFWTCLPGCLPDSDRSGPYDSELEALKDACEGLDA